MTMPLDKGHFQELLNFAETDKQRRVLNIIIANNGHVSNSIDEIGTNERSTRAMLARITKRAAACGYSPNEDQRGRAPDGYRVRGKSTLYDGDGNIAAQWVKTQALPGQESESYLETITAALEDRAEKAGPKPRKLIEKPTQGLLSMVMVGDPHFGALAWGRETGADNFDTDIARDDLMTAMGYLIDQSPPSEVGMICQAGDLFHADGVNAVTPGSGHLLDTDTRLSHTLEAATEAFVFAIDRALERHGRVVVVNLRGNHDPSLGLAFNKIIAAYYRQEPRVEIMDNTPKFMVYQHGTTLLAFHHTDRLNVSRWHEALTRDFPRLWGSTEYRYGHGGHVHHMTTKEHGGCIFTQWPTLAAPDAWHAASGYGAGRSASVVTYSDEWGEVSRSTIGIDRVRVLQKA